MTKLNRATTLRKYQTVLLAAIALRNVLRVWARDDVRSIVYSSELGFWAKTVSGQIVECVALGALCLFLLGFLNGIEIRPTTVPPKAE